MLRLPRLRQSAAAAFLALSAGLAAPADATWSIIIIDTRTGEIALASATCLTGFDLEANTPVLIPGVGGATCQSFVDSDGTNRTYIRDRLLAGVDPAEILAGLSTFDPTHQTRQYGIADVHGRAITFSGTGAGAWAGGRVGHIGTLVYAVQGNVLTGPPVVDQAVAAIESTPGDIAAKLMAGMEAARAMGGDGRCSCTPNNPTGCGSPPPTFTKSAHIAYMLIARAGDHQNCRAAYRAGRTPQAVAFADLNHDGKPDVLVANSGNPSGVAVLANRTALFGPASLADAVVTAAGSNTRELATADFNRDGNPDVILTNSTSTTAGILLGDGAGGFRTPFAQLVGQQPAGVVVADFNGDHFDDFATANTGSDDISIVLGNGDGTFRPQIRVAVGDGPVSLSVADLNADGIPDLAVALGAGRGVWLVNNRGDGTFDAASALTLTNIPNHILARDLSGDGRADLVTSSIVESFVRLFIARPGGGFDTSTLPLVGQASMTALGNADRDGIPDLFALTRSMNMIVFRGHGDGTFFPGVQVPVGFNSNRFAVGDLDGDGDDDAVYSSGNTAVVVSNLTAPGSTAVTFGEAGCASGPGYMDFNVANRAAGDPDPVFTLRGLYEQWRTGLQDLPDAVLSTVSAPQGTLPSDGRTTVDLDVQLLDWRGLPVSGPATFELDPDLSAARGCQVVSAVGTGDGRYAVTVRTGTSCGDARLALAVEVGASRVVLMPFAGLELGPAADFDLDGFVDFLDLEAFAEAFDLGLPRADRNGDGRFDADDLAQFIDQFEQGCRD